MPAGAPYGNQNAKTYNTEDLYNEAMTLVNNHSMHFIEDIIANMVCSPATFYEYLKIDSIELKDIKDQLEKNRITEKQKMRKDWKKSDNATLQISLYKLIGTPEERQKLSQAHLDIKSDGEKITGINYVVPEKKEGE